MGEDLAAPGRTAVRTPMQWSRGRNGGFSTAAPSRLVQAVVEGAYGPEHVNVEDQQADEYSLWRYVARLASGRLTADVLRGGSSRALGHRLQAWR